MRCKEGDLAFINRGVGQSKYGTVKEFLGVFSAPFEYRGTLWEHSSGEPLWAFELNRPLRHPETKKFYKIIPCADTSLTPIRDQPGEDETLQWAPVPKSKVQILEKV